MPSRPSRHSRYDDDPYTFDDPYRHEPPTLAQNVGYEYVGTDEPGTHSRPASPPPRYESRRHSPERRKHRTSSPPRSRRHRDHDSSPRTHTKESSPHRRPRRHSASPQRPPKDARVPVAARGKQYQEKYQEWAQRPNVKRAQTYGKKGLTFMGEAAAAYIAAQHGQDPRELDLGGRSSDRDKHGKGDRRSRDVRGDSPPRRRPSRREPSYSPSPPPRRRHHHSRQDSYSVSPTRSRGYDDDDRHRRDRRPRGRAYSPSPSPSRSHRRPRGKSTPGGKSDSFRDAVKDGFKTKENANAARWQMAARAALEAGGVAAFRLRKQPGAWTGAKGAKVATAALGAAAIDAFVDKDPRRSSEGGMKSMAQNVIGGIIASKVTGVSSASRRSGKSRF